MSTKKKVVSSTVSTSATPRTAVKVSSSRSTSNLTSAAAATTNNHDLTPRRAHTLAQFQQQLQQHQSPASHEALHTSSQHVSTTATTLNPYGPSMGSVSPSSLYWHNLLLLGFDPAHAANRFKIECGPFMFEKPNAKGMQVLMHFLLLKIKSCPQSETHNSATEWKELTTVFHHSFPCIDRTQARDFLACCVGALTGFEKGPANVFPAGTIRKSHFAAPQGERLYTIFWHLSTYALHLQLTMLYPNSPPLPLLTLPPLHEHIQFPHLIRALKLHIVRQSNLYLTKLQMMEHAEDEWRHKANELTIQHEEVAREIEKHTQAMNAPFKIPGQATLQTEADIERNLFSPQANAERLTKLNNVRHGHMQLKRFFAKYESRKKNINDIMEGTWKSTIIHRNTLQHILARHAASDNETLNFKEVVEEWNQSLKNIQSILTQYLQESATSASYLNGLASSNEALSVHFREHELKLTNLRTLSHHLRAELLPELEEELAKLQRDLAAAGLYEGPIHATAPALIPPTPANKRAPGQGHGGVSLTVPQTPASSSSSVGGQPFARSSVPFTPMQAGIRVSARGATGTGVGDSVRRAAQAKGSFRYNPGAGLSAGLSTIVDEETTALSPKAQTSGISNRFSPRQFAAQQQQRAQMASATKYSPASKPEEEAKYNHTSPQLTSPLMQLGGSSKEDSISPQFPKKLVFSPTDGSRIVTSPPSNSTSPLVVGSTRDSFSPTDPRLPSAARLSNASAASTLISPVQLQAQQPYSASKYTTASASQRRSFTPSYPETSSVTSSASTSRFLSPSSDIQQQADEGLLGNDELFDTIPTALDEDLTSHTSVMPRTSAPAATTSATRGSPATPAAPTSSTSTYTAPRTQQSKVTIRDEIDGVEQGGDDTAEEEEEEEEEEDEVVFASHPAARRFSDKVDPNAPTPVPASRTSSRTNSTTPAQQMQQHRGWQQDDRTPPQPSASKYAVSGTKHSFLSPSYDFGSAAGLLDE